MSMDHPDALVHTVSKSFVQCWNYNGNNDPCCQCKAIRKSTVAYYYDKMGLKTRAHSDGNATCLQVILKTSFKENTNCQNNETIKHNA